MRKLPGTGKSHPPNQKLVNGNHFTEQHVQGFGCNPHIVDKEDNDLEVVNEVGVDEDEDNVGPESPVSPSTMKRRRKAAKARRD